MNVERLFFFRDNEVSDDHEYIAYIKPQVENRDHFIWISGPCYEKTFPPSLRYEQIDTVLSEKEFENLIELSKIMPEIISTYRSAKARIDAIRKINQILEKLKSKENDALFQKVQRGERKKLKNNYGLSDKDINFIFKNHPFGYKDASVVCNVFNSTEEMAIKSIKNNPLVKIPLHFEKYFDYKTYGQDLHLYNMIKEDYGKLPSGRIIHWNI